MAKKRNQDTGETGQVDETAVEQHDHEAGDPNDKLEGASDIEASNTDGQDPEKDPGTFPGTENVTQSDAGDGEQAEGSGDPQDPPVDGLDATTQDQPDVDQSTQENDQGNDEDTPVDYPSAVILESPYGFIDEEGDGQQKFWNTGTVVDDPEQIKILVDRKAPVLPVNLDPAASL